MIDENVPVSYALRRNDAPLLRFMGNKLAEHKRVYWTGIVIQTLYKTVNDKYVYHEYEPLIHRSRVRVFERLEIRDYINSWTVSLFEQAARRDSDLTSHVYEEIR